MNWQFEVSLLKLLCLYRCLKIWSLMAAKGKIVTVNDREPTVSMFVSCFLLLKCFKCEDSNKNMIYNFAAQA